VVDGEPLAVQVARLRAENARLRRLLELTPEQARPPAGAQTGLFLDRPGPVTAASAGPDKVRFFRALFVARADVFATRWENTRAGRSGWVPAVVGGWRKGETRPHLRLTDSVVEAHLTGETHIGLYPMLAGDTCQWLAADFDGPSAMLDALSYLKAARAVGVPAALEVSRSGVGAHVWVFFTGAVAASTARTLGSGLIREAIALRGRMDLAGYDRLFPSQDVLPAGGMGNLIAAPLHGRSRRDGATVFLDLGTLEPHEDQWAYLSSLHRLTPREVERLAARVGPVRVGTAVARLHQQTSSRTHPRPPATVRLTLAAGVSVEMGELTPAMLATLKHAATMANPAFYDRQRRRFSTWGVPRFLHSFDETLDGRLVLPRGLADVVSTVITEAGSSPKISDERASGRSQESFDLGAQLREDQERAVEDLAEHDLGVLVAPPGAGKTVIACALIARHETSTLVLVDRKTLADQWRARIVEHLGVTPGQLGGGRAKLRGTVDIATLQTLARRDDLPELTAGYGFVVVDECHHIPAAAFENAVRQVKARRWLGLTATPYRRDELDDLIAQQLGPTRHTMTAPEPGTLAAAAAGGTPDRTLTVHETAFTYLGDADPSAPGGIAAIYRDLAADQHRNRQIVDDVMAAIARARNCLVLTQWTAHVDALGELLRATGHDPVVLKGGMGSRGRRDSLERLALGNGPMLAVATGPYVGEGFDCPALDTLFLAAPIAFKGRLVQYVGRILRPAPGKTVAEVHDYHDVDTGVLASSLTKRAPGYVSLGFPDPRKLRHVQPHPE
jgi:superfamily II DNA or RNA helicase